MIQRLKNLMRHSAAAARGGTVRYYCRDLSGFYEALRKENIRPVVLRWTCELPLNKELEQAYRDDVDHLIGDQQAQRIGRIAARFSGPIKCDFYSVSGQSGSSYKGMPYYPPARALRMMDNSVSHQDGYTELNERDAFFSFAYHLCYHKGPRSGIALEAEIDPPKPHSRRNYLEELSRLAQKASIELPETITISNLDQFLRENGWAMPYDLMTRWPDRHSYLDALIQRQTSKMQQDAQAAKDLTIFIIRADCEGQETKNLAKQTIKQRFSILREISLTKTQQVEVMENTRGGNWIEKYTGGVVAPVEAIVCQNSESPGPLPEGLSVKKLKKRYPHVEHTDVLIKREIRKLVNRQLGEHNDRVVIHATDNRIETGEMLRVLLGDHWTSQL